MRERLCRLRKPHETHTGGSTTAKSPPVPAALTESGPPPPARTRGADLGRGCPVLPLRLLRCPLPTHVPRSGLAGPAGGQGGHARDPSQGRESSAAEFPGRWQLPARSARGKAWSRHSRLALGAAPRARERVGSPGLPRRSQSRNHSPGLWARPRASSWSCGGVRAGLTTTPPPPPHPPAPPPSLLLGGLPGAGDGHRPRASDTEEAPAAPAAEHGPCAVHRQEVRRGPSQQAWLRPACGVGGEPRRLGCRRGVGPPESRQPRSRWASGGAPKSSASWPGAGVLSGGHGRGRGSCVVGAWGGGGKECWVGARPPSGTEGRAQADAAERGPREQQALGVAPALQRLAFVPQMLLRFPKHLPAPSVVMERRPKAGAGSFTVTGPARKSRVGQGRWRGRASVQPSRPPAGPVSPGLARRVRPSRRGAAGAPGSQGAAQGEAFGLNPGWAEQADPHGSAAPSAGWRPSVRPASCCTTELAGRRPAHRFCSPVTSALVSRAGGEADPGQRRRARGRRLRG